MIARISSGMEAPSTYTAQGGDGAAQPVLTACRQGKCLSCKEMVTSIVTSSHNCRDSSLIHQVAHSVLGDSNIG